MQDHHDIRFLSRTLSLDGPRPRGRDTRDAPESAGSTYLAGCAPRRGEIGLDREYIETVPDVPGCAGSVWLDAEAVEYPPLYGEGAADILIVGCGLTGALVARKLAGQGRAVTMLERRRIAAGTTGHSTAKVTALHGDSWQALLAKNPRAEVRTWAEANLAAVEELSAIALDLGTTCRLRRMPA